MGFLLDELEEVSAGSKLPTPNLGMRIGRWIRKQYKMFPLLPEVVKQDEREGVVVTYSSSLAHVYWSDRKEPLTFDEIRADLREDALTIEVENPRPATPGRTANEGVGLRNAAERLRLLFGAGAMLQLDLSHPGMATTRIRIPHTL